MAFVSCAGPLDDDDSSPANDDDSGLADDDDATPVGSLFDDVSEEAGMVDATGGFGVGAADINADGWPDLFYPSPKGTRLFLNQGDGTFVDVAAAWGLANQRRKGEGAPFGSGAVKFDVLGLEAALAELLHEVGNLAEH